LDALTDQGTGECTEIGIAAGCHHDCRGTARDHVRAHETQTAGFQRCLCVDVGTSKFLHRHRFAGQCGLIDEQVLGTEQAQIGRHHVARGQVYNVARHQRVDLQLELFRDTQRGRLLISVRLALVHFAPHRRSIAHHAP